MLYRLKVIFKYPYQRIRYGYDERIKWGFDGYLSQIVHPLQEFCLEQLEETAMMKLNPRRKRVFTKTLKLIEEYLIDDGLTLLGRDNPTTRLWSYFGKNIQIYWD